MPERDIALDPFDALIGTWATKATHPLVDAVVPDTVTFEWLEGGHFLLQRSRNDHESFPDTMSVIGVPAAGEGLVMEYFDSRGVRRTYGVSGASGEIFLSSSSVLSPRLGASPSRVDGSPLARRAIGRTT